MFLYYINSSFFQSDKKSNILCSRILHLCEKIPPRAILINGEVTFIEGYHQFIKSLEEMHISYYQSSSTFTTGAFQEILSHYSDALEEEMDALKSDVLYKLYTKEQRLERIYMQMFIEHEIEVDPDFLEELEDRLRSFGKEVQTIIIKPKMN